MVGKYARPSKDDPVEKLPVFVKPVIYGSAILSNVITIYGFNYAVGDIVKSAFINSKLQLEEWNALPYNLRDEIIGAQLTMMRARLENNDKMSWLTAVSIRVKGDLLKKKIRLLCLETKDIDCALPKPMKDKVYQ